ALPSLRGALRNKLRWPLAWIAWAENRRYLRDARDTRRGALRVRQATGDPGRWRPSAEMDREMHLHRSARQTCAKSNLQGEWNRRNYRLGRPKAVPRHTASMSL